MSTPPEEHPYPAHEERDVVLRSGATARLRPIRPSDAPALLRFYKGLSPNSLYFRFFSLPAIDADRADDFCRIDYDDVMALVCEAGGSLVAIAQYFRFPNRPERAEVAFIVDDAVQGQGIGTRLLESLAEIAREHGITTFEAEVLGDNRRMLGVFANCGFETTERRIDVGVERVVLTLAPTRFYELRAAERSERAASASMKLLFEPERRRGDRRREGARKDRGRDLPQPGVERIQGKGNPDQSERGHGTGHEGVRAAGGLPGTGGPRRHRDPRRKSRGRRRRVRREGRQGDRRDHGGIFGNGRGGPAPRGRSAREDPPLGHADGRPELHGPPQHRPAGLAEHDFFARLSAGGQRGAFLPERRARPRPPRARHAAEPRDLELRLRREQGGRVRQRLDPVLVGGSAHERDPAVPRELRKPGPLFADRAPRRPHETDRRGQERTLGGGRARRFLAHGRARSNRTRSWTRSSGRPASFAPRRSRSSSTSRRSSRTSPSRRGAASRS